MALPRTVQFYVNSVPFGSSVPIAADGTAQINWTPSNGSEVSLKAKYMPTVNGNGVGTAFIMIDVYDSKNLLLTHASVRVDVKTGIRPRGDSTRQIGAF